MPHFTVVLVEPQVPANIGMVCRAMANFNVNALRLVNPCNHLDPLAYRLAVGATHLLERSEIHPSLEAALADQHTSVAATRRSGRYRGDLVTLADFAANQARRYTQQRLALVFGREDSGLTREEVGLCQHAVVVETSEQQGSLNLAQAVLLFLYELTRQPAGGTPIKTRPTQADSEQLCEQVSALLDQVGYLNPQRPEAILSPLRRLLTRADPDGDEFNLLRGMFSRLTASVHAWPGKRRGKPD